MRGCSRGLLNEVEEMKKIVYNGDVKVIKRLCDVVNEIIDGGASGGGALFYGSDGGLYINYDEVPHKEDN